jgi:hypothetical protein
MTDAMFHDLCFTIVVIAFFMLIALVVYITHDGDEE